MILKYLWKVGLALWLIDIIDKHFTNSLGNKFFNALGVAGAVMTVFFGGMRLAMLIYYRNDKKTPSPSA